MGYPEPAGRATLSAMADAYLQSLLADSEAIRSEARQHPMALVRFAFQPILVFLAALVCLAIGMWLTPDGQGLFSDIVRWIDTLLGLLTAGLFILAIVWFPIQVFRWTKRRYMVTDRRVLYVDGVWRKNSMDAGLSMITDVGFRQGVMGRSLGYGDLVIATASNRPLQFREIRDALAFKQAIMAAQHATIEARADEILMSKGLAPAASAPVAAASTTAAAPVAAAAVAAVEVAAAPVEPEPPSVPAWDGSDVPQMREDDTPPADPMIFGTPGEPRAEEVVETVAQAAETDDEVVAAVASESTDVPHMMEEDTPDIDPMLAGGPVPHDVADEAAAPVTDTAEDVADASADAADAAAVEVEAAVPETVETTEDAPEAAAETTAEATGTIEDAPEAAAETAAEATGTGGHVAALQDVDATIGGLTDSATGSGADSVTSAIASLAELRDSGAITAEEFESRKQDLLERL